MKTGKTIALMVLSACGLAISALPARADAVLTGLTITAGPSANGCKPGTSGGTLDATASSLFLDFGPGTFGVNETCGAHLVTETAGGALVTGTTLNAGTYTFKGAICELQGVSDGCNPANPTLLSDVIQLVITSTTITISDTSSGGSFSIAVNGGTPSGTPEPTSFILIGSGLLALGLVRRQYGKSQVGDPALTTTHNVHRNL